jgi:hypothetical protein
MAELLGAVGVIVSLLYLARQIRQSTETEKARAHRDVFSSLNAHTGNMLSAENIDLLIAGMRNFESLKGGDRMRFDHLMLGYFNSIESTLFYKNALLLDDDVLANWAYTLKTRFLPYAGVRTWWREARSIFNPEMQAWVDEQLAATDKGVDVLEINE